MTASSPFPDLPNTPEEGGSTTSFGSTQSLYRKYRPQTFEADDLVGQDAIVRTLRNAIRLDRVAHAYLFTGPRGTGKTTTARLLAKAVNCLDPDPDARPCNRCAACVAINTGATTDIIEIDAASNRGIDDIRELRERVKFAPTFLKTKFYIVDEAHQITGAAANAFLKTLEEPPPHTKFILATTDPEQLLPTIVSRCQRFDFKRFSRATVIEHLARVAEQEGVPVERDALDVIGEHAAGSMRDALGLLDQLASYREQNDADGDHPIDADDVRNLLGVARSERVLRLANALADADAGAGLSIISDAFEAGEDPRQLNRQLVSLLRSVMFQVAAGKRGTDPEVDRLAARFSLGDIARHSARFSEIDYRIRHASLPQLPLEIAFVQATLDSGTAQAVSAAPPPRESSASRDRASVDRESDSRAPRSAASHESRAPRRTETPSTPAPVATTETSASIDGPASSPAPRKIQEDAPQVRGSGAITVDQLHDLWPKIRLDVKARDRRIEALLSSCDPADVDGSRITLVTSYKFHWEKMNEDATRDLLQQIIGRLVGQPVTVATEMRGTPSHPTSNGSAPRESGQSAPPANAQPASPQPEPAHGEDARTIIEAARNIFDAEELTPRS
ncbi:MAG: DNA polymerase III subunit gamma/tau [Thermomicrobiales bacterium]|nr:DNA polymerase III subunit gamma/tau [Thermomicrobiales bacterium]